MDQTLKLIKALREVAFEIKMSDHYQWGHMGRCNCGFLAQKLSPYSAAEIHRMAMSGHGDWNDQLIDYCPVSNYPMDRLIFDLLQQGLTLQDLAHLEKLSDPKILLETRKVKPELAFNNPEDVSLYMNTWGLILEREIANKEIKKKNSHTPITTSLGKSIPSEDHLVTVDLLSIDLLSVV